MNESMGLDAIGMPIIAAPRQDFVALLAEKLRAAAIDAASEFPEAKVTLSVRADPRAEEVSIAVTRSLP